MYPVKILRNARASHKSIAGKILWRVGTRPPGSLTDRLCMKIVQMYNVQC